VRSRVAPLAAGALVAGLALACAAGIAGAHFVAATHARASKPPAAPTPPASGDSEQVLKSFVIDKHGVRIETGRATPASRVWTSASTRARSTRA
jgi:hypothetical protein